MVKGSLMHGVGRRSPGRRIKKGVLFHLGRGEKKGALLQESLGSLAVMGREQVNH